jgi:hypothetical protein
MSISSSSAAVSISDLLAAPSSKARAPTARRLRRGPVAGERAAAAAAGGWTGTADARADGAAIVGRAETRQAAAPAAPERRRRESAIGLLFCCCLRGQWPEALRGAAELV